MLHQFPFLSIKTIFLIDNVHYFVSVILMITILFITHYHSHIMIWQIEYIETSYIVREIIIITIYKN